jgi:hypothetical protein
LKPFKSFDFEWRTSLFHLRFDSIHNLKLNLKYDILQWEIKIVTCCLLLYLISK